MPSSIQMYSTQTSRGLWFTVSNQTFLTMLTIFLMLLASLSVLPDKVYSASTSLQVPKGKEETNSFFSELLTYSKSKKCFFPFKEVVQNPPHVQEINTLCDSQLSDPQKIGSKKLCILIADMFSSICDLTPNFDHQEYLKSYSLNITTTSLSDVLKTNKTLDVFCKELFQDERLPAASDVKAEIKQFYEAFLDVSDDGKSSCSSVCQNYPEGDSAVKISPLCIVFNLTSVIYKNVATIGTKSNKLELSASHVPINQDLKQVQVNVTKSGDSDIVNVSKRKDSVFETEVKLDGKSASSAKEKGTELKELDKGSSLTANQLDVNHKSSVGPGIQDTNMALNKDKIPPKSKPSSSTPSSSVADNFGEIDPPLIKGDSIDNSKSSSVAPPNAGKSKDNSDNGMGQEKSESKLPSAGNQEKPPLKKDDVAEQVPAQSKVTNDYDDDDALPPNLGSDDDISIPSESDNDGRYTNVDQNIIKKEDMDKPNKKETFIYQANVENYESGGYFNYFVFFVTFLALCFLVFHNRRRLVAYIVEGRKPRGQRSRRRSSSESGASYRRLENNFE